MSRQDAFQELVVLFDDSGSRTELEMRFGQFNNLLAQKGALESHADRTVKAAYAQVGAGLAVRAAVFFQLKFNAQGYMDPAFNLPLEYMALNAGEGPDLGRGPISMACRSQCPVPWHGINMWEPTGEGSSHPAMLVQKAVWRNRLGLKPVPATRRSLRVSKLRADRDAHDEVPVEAPLEIDEAMPMDQVVNGSPVAATGETSRQTVEATDPASARVAAPPVRASASSVRAEAPPVRSKGPTSNGSRFGASAPAGGSSRVATGSSSKRAGIARMRAMEEKLTAAFGESGRIAPDPAMRQHREQMGQAAAQFRTEMERQQRGYLEQIKHCRQEIQELKAALRHEQKRNQRLQQLLRGDV